MMKFPSYSAAIFFGAIGMPIFMFIIKYIEKHFGSQLLLIGWSLIGFVLPLLISTGDFRYIRNEIKKGRSLLKPWIKADDYKYLYIPAWKRTGVCFASTVISIVLLKIAGINL